MAQQEAGGAHGGVKPFAFVDGSRLLVASLAKYFNKGLFSDITVIGPDERKLLCHQVVLSAGSKRFANMLEQGNLANEELPVWGVDSDALQAIIQFFYSGECLLTFPGAVAVMDAATRLDVPSLAAAAGSYVRGALAPATAPVILSRAVQYKLHDLSAACLQLIDERFDKVVSGDAWCHDLSVEGLRRVLAHTKGSAAVSDEASFRAAWRWLIADASHSAHINAIRDCLVVPASITVAELVATGQQGPLGREGTTAAAMALLVAAVSSAPAAQQQQQQPAGGSSQGAKQQQQQQLGGSWPAPVATGSGQKQAAASDDSHKGGASRSPPGSSAPQGSREPASAQPTPTSRAMMGPLEGGAFGAAGSSNADLTAAAAAAAASMDPKAAAAAVASAAAAAAAAGGMSAADYAAAAAAMYAAGGGYGIKAEGGHDEALNGSGQPLTPNNMAAAAAAAAAAAVAGWNAMGGYHMQQHGMMGGGAAAPGMQDGGGGAARGGGDSARNHAKGVCQVEGCNADLRGLRDYHLRYKICEHHLKIGSITRDGVPQRFCQQCGRFHPLTDFDGTKRSCRARLQRHNARRRKRGDEEGGGYVSGTCGSMKRGRGSSSQITDMDDATAAASYGMMPMDAATAYMAMMAGGYGGPAVQGGAAADGSFSSAAAAMMQQQYGGGQYHAGLVSPPAAAAAVGMQDLSPTAAAATAAMAAAAAAAPADAPGVASSPGSAGKRGGSASQQQQRSRPPSPLGSGRAARPDLPPAWAAGLEMLAEVAQARSSGADDRSNGGSDGGKPLDAAAAAAAPVAAAPEATGTQQQQEQPEAAAAPQQEQASAGSSPTAAADSKAAGMAPMQLANSASPSPHAADSGRLFAGRSSPGQDAHPTTGSNATAAAVGKLGGQAGVDAAFRGHKAGSAAGIVRG